MMTKRTGIRLIVVAMALLAALAFTYPAPAAAKAKKPEKVTSVEVSAVTYQTLTLKWDKAKYAKSYEVYRSKKKDSGYTLIKTVKKTKFTDKGLATGKKYWYRVRGINEDYNGKKSSAVSGVPKLDTPSVNLTLRGEGIIIDVTQVAGADGYAFYRDGKELMQQSETSFTDTEVKVGESHEYTAAAYRDVNGVNVFSDRTESKKGKRPDVSVEIKNGTNIEGREHQVKQSYSISGKIKSNTLMQTVEVGVKKQENEKWVSSAHYIANNVNSLSFNISGEPDKSVKFGKLKVGSYYYTVVVGLVNGTSVEVTKQSFTVVEQAPEPELVFPEEVTKGARNAVKWAKKIANDNSFAYGTGSRSHRGGCYFCGTNTGPNLKKKEKSGEKHYVKDSNGVKHTYEKTYCCNPFIFAAYAHGAKDPEILKACKKGKCGGMETRDWTKYGCFAVVGKCKKVPYSKILPGDVIISDKNVNHHYHHVIMDMGNNQYVEAGWEGWGSSTIAVRSGAKSNYEKHYKKYNGCYVLRYTGK